MKSIQLNMNETKKYLVIKAIDQGKKTKNRACVELNLSERQSNRLLLAYQQKGKEAFRHGNRNRKPKHAIPDESKIIALNLTIFLGHHHFRLTASIHYNSAHKNGEDGNPLLQILTSLQTNYS